jgi:hypothetical protein
MTALVVRPWAAAGEGQYTSLYFGDTISLDRLTLNLGARWDRGTSSILEATVPGSSADPVLLPELTAPAVKNAIDANLLTPRLGFTYALNETRKTIVRGSYAMFGSQLNAMQAAIIASQIPYYSYAYYSAVDTNNNLIADPSEFGEFLGVAGFDPDNPLGGNPDRIGDYGKPRTHEVLFGVEHEVFADFGVSANVTWRRFTNFNWLHPRGTDSRSYLLAGSVDGNQAPIGAFSVPYYIIDPDLAPADLGEIYEERPGYSQRFLGLELSATKRMSNNWMMRLGFSSNVHREYFDGPEAIDDPTRTPLNPNQDGGLVMTETAGSGKTQIFLVLPKYQFIAAGAYRAKWGINLGLNYLMRQGYSTPYFREETEAADLFNPENKQVLLVNDIDDFRLPTMHSVDARIGKTFTYQRLNVNFDVDIFNLFNASTILQRQFDQASTEFDDVTEIMNPRIVRFGVRIGF